MTKWHVKPNGEPGKCLASKRPCKYSEHYDTKEDCLQAIEEKNVTESNEIKVLKHNKTNLVDNKSMRQHEELSDTGMFKMAHGPVFDALVKDHATNQSHLARRIYETYDKAFHMERSLNYGKTISDSSFNDVMNSINNLESSVFKASNGETMRSSLSPTNKLVISKDGWRKTDVSYKYKKPNGRFDRSPMTITRHMFTNGEDLVAIDSADYNGDILIIVTNKKHPESTMSILKPSRERIVLSSDNDEISSKKLDQVISHLEAEGKYSDNTIVHITEFGTATIDDGQNHTVLSEKEINTILSK